MSRIPSRSISSIGLAACLASLAGLACSSSGEASTSSTNPLEPGQTVTPTPAPAAPVDDSAVCQTSLYCDGFEAAAAGVAPGAPWTTNVANGSVVVDTTRAFRGLQSLKASTLSSADAAGATYKSAFIGLAGTPVVPVPGEAFYGRMMFYLESSPTTSVHWTFADATGLVPGQNYHATYRYGGQLPVAGGSQLMANYDTTDWYATPKVGPQTDCYEHADGKVVPVGRWACAEWYFNGPNAEMRFWLDGAELPDLTIEKTGEGCVDPTASTWVAPTFSQLDVGWQSYQTDDARSIWIDDVVFSSTQVGCPALPQ